MVSGAQKIAGDSVQHLESAHMPDGWPLGQTAAVVVESSHCKTRTRVLEDSSTFWRRRGYSMDGVMYP